jgi:hypothetical protein
MRKHVAELIIALMIAWVLVGGKVAYSACSLCRHVLAHATA